MSVICWQDSTASIPAKAQGRKHGTRPHIQVGAFGASQPEDGRRDLALCHFGQENCARR